MKSRVLPAVIFALVCALLLVHVSRYYPFIADDALISLRYAQRLLAGDGLTWTDGRPVEGYSNLLWILLVSFLGLFKVDLITAARVLGVASTIVALGAVYRSGSRVGRAYGVAFLALSGPIAVWAIGGLEQPLVAALLAVALLFTLRIVDADRPDPSDVKRCAISLGLMCWARPDSPLFAATIFLAVMATRRIVWARVRATLPLLLIPVAFVAAQLAFRLAYYGEWLPNPAYIKLAPSAHVFGLGWSYVRDGIAAMGPMGVMGLGVVVALVAVRETRRRGVLLALVLFAWLGYLVFVGGDIFPAWRLMVPVYVTLAFAFAQCMQLLAAHWRARRSLVVVAGVLFLALPLFAAVQYRDAENTRAIEERWEWDGEVVGLFLKRAFGDREPLLACASAGCLPYFSELPSLDLLGLNDHHIARARPALEDLGDSPIAHQFGDGAYVLEREPDLVSFCVPTGGMGACFRSGKEMQETDEFFQRYRPILLRGRDPYVVDALIWVRFDSDKVGMQTTGDGHRIPAYLFRPAKGNLPTVLDEDSRPVLLLEPGQSASLSLSGLDMGDIDAEVLASEHSRVVLAVEPTANGIRLVLRASGQGPAQVAEVVVHLLAPAE